MCVLCICVGVWMWVYILLRRRSWERVIVLSVSLLETEAGSWNNNPLCCVLLLSKVVVCLFFSNSTKFRSKNSPI